MDTERAVDEAGNTDVKKILQSRTSILSHASQPARASSPVQKPLFAHLCLMLWPMMRVLNTGSLFMGSLYTSTLDQKHQHRKADWMP